MQWHSQPKMDGYDTPVPNSEEGVCVYVCVMRSFRKAELQAQEGKMYEPQGSGQWKTVL